MERPFVDYYDLGTHFEVFIILSTNLQVREEVMHDEFFSWLQRSGRTHWEINYPDHTGTHCQALGEYTTLHEYLSEQAYRTIEDDLYLFLLYRYHKNQSI